MFRRPGKSLPRLLFILLVSSKVTYGASTNLGTFGRTWLIEEANLIDVILEQAELKVEGGEWQQLMEAERERASLQVQRPTGVELPRASAPSTTWFDPTVIIPHDIADANGHVIWPAGTEINPLDHIAFDRTLLFFDGDDPAQRAWARSIIDERRGDIIALVTKGPVVDLMQAWNTRLYVDQGGRYATYFGITSVPAVAQRDGNRLRVDTVVVKT